MSHHAPRAGYADLLRRLNRFPQGAPPSDLLYRILALLFTETEADLVARLPLRPFTARKAAAVWKKPEPEARAVLDRLCDRGLLLDLERDGSMLYLLPPPMAGFFEFSLMRVRPELDQQELSRLFFQYINVEQSFIRELFAGGATQLGRVLVQEPALAPEQGSQVLDYERASAIIGSARQIAVGLCYCRHKMSHLGRACDAPLDICMTLNDAAHSLIRHGHARSAEPTEALDLLQEAQARGLVQCADNVQQGVNFICHCCGCCCEALLAVKRLALPNALYTTNFIPRLERARCSGCGGCAAACPIEALTMGPQQGSTPFAATIPLPPGPEADLRQAEPQRTEPALDEEICLGCGLCVRSCPRRALRLASRPQRIVTPVNTAHRVVLMALERGRLQHLIFDNQAHLSHRILAGLLGALLRLPPLKRAAANRQLNSRYLARLFEGVDVTAFSD